jgi:NitT/TauT family transport system ATP-binding protein
MIRPVISVTGLNVHFGKGDRKVVALDDVSLEARPQEFLSVLGPSGCGKSTLLYVVAGLLPATAGEVQINGKKLTGPYTDAGIVFQRDELLEWRTVIENVMLPVQIKRLPYAQHFERARELLEKVGLGGFEHAYPHQLSGGMRQRAALCRALVCNVSMLLMDEPFGALDALSREEHQLLLQDVWLSHKMTVMFITHDIHEAVMLSDRVIIMSARPGRISEVIKIDLPRPRDPDLATTPEFNACVKRIRSNLFSRKNSAEKPAVRAAS